MTFTLFKSMRRLKCMPLALCGLIAGSAFSGLGADVMAFPAWDKGMLSVDLGNVQVDAGNIVEAWREITTKYLLRANFYTDQSTDSDKTPFVFHKEKATAQQLLDAFLRTYSYAYAQNPESGIIWVYPKTLKYDEILKQRIKVVKSAIQIPMYSDIYIPLIKLLTPSIIDSTDAGIPGSGPIDLSTGKPPIPFDWLYDVDLPAGNYSVRQILDYCCAANPTKAFLVQPVFRHQRETLVIFLKNLIYFNPLVPPRVEAIKFWELENGKTTNGAPNLEEVRAAMSNSDSQKRLAASLYVEASRINYPPANLIGKAGDSDQAVWTALGVEYAEWRDADTNFFTGMMRSFPRLREDLKKIKNPNLALIASLQLTRERKDTSYLDDTVSKHIYSEEDIASIKPELVRMARSSKAVRDTLRAMKIDVPEFAPKALEELADTNFLTLVPADQK